MHNASERKDIRRAEKAEKAALLARSDFIKASMSVPSGRAWFHTLLTSCHLFHVLPPTTPLIREFAEGERNVGIQIYNDLLAFCPDLYILMLHEAQHQDLSNARSDPDLYPDASAPSQYPRSPESGWDPDRPAPRDGPSDDAGWPEDLIGYTGE